MPSGNMELNSECWGDAVGPSPRLSSVVFGLSLRKVGSQKIVVLRPTSFSMTVGTVARFTSRLYGHTWSHELEFLHQFSSALLVLGSWVCLVEVSAALVPPYRRHCVVLNADLGDAMLRKDSLKNQFV